MANYDASATNKSNQSVRTFKDLNLDFDRNTVTNDVLRLKMLSLKEVLEI